METEYKMTKPEEYTVILRSYVTRKANRMIQSVFSDYPDVNIQTAQKKLEAVVDSSQEEQMKVFSEISGREMEAIRDLQEVMVRGMIEKVTRGDKELSEKEIDEVLELMTDEEFGELSKVSSEIIASTRKKTEKKTK